MATARSAPRDGGEFTPIVAINTTPLVDVMLVLLIMFIIIIPAATHKVPLDLPRPGPAAPVPVHRLEIAASGAIAYDGVPTTMGALPARLTALAADRNRPELQLHPDAEARYERVDQVLALIRGAGVARLGFVDNARHRSAF